MDGISQSKVADLYDVSQGTVSNALKEKRHEVELNHLKGAITRGIACGVQAALENSTFSNNTLSGFIDINE